MIAGRRHQRHLAQELRSRGKEVIVPVAVIALAADEVPVHERDVAVEATDEVLHIRPVLASVAVDIADGEDAAGSALLGCSLGAAYLIKPACSTCANGEVVAGIGLQSGEGNHMHIAFVGYIPPGIGSYLLVKIVGACAVEYHSFGSIGLFRHLPKHFDRSSGWRHRIWQFIRFIGIV